MTDRQTIAAYDAQADRYATLEHSADQVAALDRFIAALPPDGRVLDLGCGPGLQAKQMLDAGLAVEAIDATPAFVAAAKALGVEARLGTFDTLDDVAGFDGIFASFSLLHAPRADLPRHVAQIARALRPNGIAFFGMKIGSGEARDTLGRRYSYITVEDMTALLRDNDLTPFETVTGEAPGLSGSVDPYFLMTARRADA